MTAAVTDGPATFAVSGFADPPGEAPWAMQIAARVEKTAPPSATALAEACAIAVVTFLDVAADDPAWAAAVRRWQEGRIRKVVRRARGTAWTRAETVAGVTVDHRGAQVRAVVPGPVDAVAADLARLQVSGLVLDDPDRCCAVTDAEGVAGDDGVVVAVTPTVSMSAGKLAAQCGHAAHLAWLVMSAERRRRWAAGGYRVVVAHPGQPDWQAWLAAAPVHVADAGFTEIPPGTVTAAAAWH